MKTFKVIFTVDDNGTKRRGEMEVNANSSNEAAAKLIEALKQIGVDKVTIITSNEV
jgi:biopolymer transport protein ExbD